VGSTETEDASTRQRDGKPKSRAAPMRRRPRWICCRARRDLIGWVGGRRSGPRTLAASGSGEARRITVALRAGESSPGARRPLRNLSARQRSLAVRAPKDSHELARADDPFTRKGLFAGLI
jgi:hypothetical protein